LEHCTGYNKIEYCFFPPELLPRLASRGIIEVERKKKAFLKHCRQKFNAKLFHLLATGVHSWNGPSSFQLPTFSFTMHLGRVGKQWHTLAPEVHHAGPQW